MFILEILIFIAGFWIAYAMGLRRGYSIGYEEALILKIKTYIKADLNDQDKSD